MNDDDLKMQFRRVFAVYPTIPDWVMKNVKDPKATFAAWRKMISTCDDEDVIDVVDRIERGDLEVFGRYDKIDTLPRLIRAQANARRHRRSEFRERETFHQSLERIRRSGSYANGRLPIAIQESLRTGHLHRAKKIDDKENARRVAVLCEWCNNDKAPSPDWVPR